MARCACLPAQLTCRWQCVSKRGSSISGTAAAAPAGMQATISPALSPAGAHPHGDDAIEVVEEKFPLLVDGPKQVAALEMICFIFIKGFLPFEQNIPHTYYTFAFCLRARAWWVEWHRILNDSVQTRVRTPAAAAVQRFRWRRRRRSSCSRSRILHLSAKTGFGYRKARSGCCGTGRRSSSCPSAARCSTKNSQRPSLSTTTPSGKEASSSSPLHCTALSPLSLAPYYSSSSRSHSWHIHHNISILSLTFPWPCPLLCTRPHGISLPRFLRPYGCR